MPTINNFIGFEQLQEKANLYELADSYLAYVIDQDSPDRNTKGVAYVGNNVTAFFELHPFESVPKDNASDYHVLGFNLKYDSAPAPNGISIVALDSVGQCIKIKFTFDTVCQMYIYDSAGFIFAAPTIDIGGISSWHRFEIIWHNVISTNNLKVYVDGASVYNGPAQNRSFNQSGNPFDTYRFENVNDFSGRAASGIKFDDIYMLSGAVGNDTDLIGAFEVVTYHNDVNDTQIGTRSYGFDTGKFANGNVLDQGNARLLGDEIGLISSTTFAAYTDNSKGGYWEYSTTSTGGPAADTSREWTDIKAYKYTWMADRGTGPGTTHYFFAGGMADDQNTIYTNAFKPTLINDLTTYNYVSETLGPSINDNFIQGFGVSGNQDIQVYEMFAHVLHKLPENTLNAATYYYNLFQNQPTINLAYNKTMTTDLDYVGIDIYNSLLLTTKKIITQNFPLAVTGFSSELKKSNILIASLNTINIEENLDVILDRANSISVTLNNINITTPYIRLKWSGEPIYGLFWGQEL